MRESPVARGKPFHGTLSGLSRKRDAVESEQARLGRIFAAPNNALGAEIATALGIVLSRESSAAELLRRPEIDMEQPPRLDAQ